MHETFNLSPPPDFVGFDEHQPMRRYQRHLPHWRQTGAFYAVTFRLADALPQAKLNELKRHRERWEQDNPEPRDESQWQKFASEVTRMTERWMDEGYGACYFRDPRHRQLMADALRFYESTKCSVPCLIVMPNHVHAIMQPHSGHELEDVLQVIKGWTAREIKRSKVNRCDKVEASPIWAEESYDRIIRDEEHLHRVVQYIGRNGRIAGLPRDAYFRWIRSDWITAGWDFRED